MERREETSASADDVHARLEMIADRLATFKKIEPVRLPVLRPLIEQMEILRLGGTRREPGETTDAMCVQLPSGVGKSTAARMMARAAAERAKADPAKGPVLIVDLDVEETVSLWNAILRALGDPYWMAGSPKNLKARAIKYLKKRGVELIIVDEFNHCIDRGQARLIMNTIKEILNAGVAPVVAMGTDEELGELPKNTAFERRMLHAPAIGPLVWGDDEHERSWRGFLQALDEWITSKDVLPQASRLHGKAMAKALWEACGGVLGHVHWVVQDALTEVLKRGGTNIERLDLAVSVNRLFVKHRLEGRINAVEGLA